MVSSGTCVYAMKAGTAAAESQQALTLGSSAVVGMLKTHAAASTGGAAAAVSCGRYSQVVSAW
jgi:hypothetical protein